MYKQCTHIKSNENVTICPNDEGTLKFVLYFRVFIVPAVVSFIAHSADTTADGLTFPEACKRLEEAGANVVGLNCGRGPKTMMPLMKEIRKVCKVLFL